MIGSKISLRIAYQQNKHWLHKDNWPDWLSKEKKAPAGDIKLAEIRKVHFPASIVEKDSMQKINELFKPKDAFHIIIESYHIDDDKGESSLFLDRKKKTGGKPNTVFVDVSNKDELRDDYYFLEQDPSKFKSMKSDRGPFISAKWIDSTSPIMTVHRLIFINFSLPVFQSRIEAFVMNTIERPFRRFYRQMICWMDHYIELNMDDIRTLELRIKKELDEQRKYGEFRGVII